MGMAILRNREDNHWELPRIDFGAPPPPPPPLEIAQNYLLVFYSQLLKRVPVVLCLGALTGPRESPPPPPPPSKLPKTL